MKEKTGIKDKNSKIIGFVNTEVGVFEELPLFLYKINTEIE